MLKSTDTLRIHLSAIALALSGVFFVLYPSIRPFSDESSIQGAQAFASFSWVFAHSLAMVAFVLLALGLLGLYGLLYQTTVERRAIQALVLTWIGVGLTLPYYGAETFGLHAIGQKAISEKNPALLSLVNSIRLQEGLVFFLPGLALLAAGTILFAIAIRRSGRFVRWIGIPLAVGFTLYLPQFFAPQPVRVVHGLLIMIACLLITWTLLKRNNVAKNR
jgi:hypothetical protein